MDPKTHYKLESASPSKHAVAPVAEMAVPSVRSDSHPALLVALREGLLCFNDYRQHTLAAAAAAAACREAITALAGRMALGQLLPQEAVELLIAHHCSGEDLVGLLATAGDTALAPEIRRAVFSMRWAAQRPYLEIEDSVLQGDAASESWLDWICSLPRAERLPIVQSFEWAKQGLDDGQIEELVGRLRRILPPQILLKALLASLQSRCDEWVAADDTVSMAFVNRAEIALALAKQLGARAPLDCLQTLYHAAPLHVRMVAEDLLNQRGLKRAGELFWKESERKYPDTRNAMHLRKAALDGFVRQTELDLQLAPQVVGRLVERARATRESDPEISIACFFHLFSSPLVQSGGGRVGLELMRCEIEDGRVPLFTGSLTVMAQYERGARSVLRVLFAGLAHDEVQQLWKAYVRLVAVEVIGPEIRRRDGRVLPAGKRLFKPAILLQGALGGALLKWSMAPAENLRRNARDVLELALTLVKDAERRRFMSVLVPAFLEKLGDEKARRRFADVVQLHIGGGGA